MAGGIRRRRLLGGIATAVAVAVAGCSSDGDSGDSPAGDGEDSGNPTGDSGASSSDTGSNDGTDDSSGTDENSDSPDIPDEYVLHLVPGRNEELREQIPDDQPAAYEQEFGTDLIEDSTVFADDPGEEWRQLEVDLLALEWWHDNDYLNIEPEEGNQFVESICVDSPEGSIEHQAKNNPLLVRYPNSNGESNTYGHFDLIAPSITTSRPKPARDLA